MGRRADRSTGRQRPAGRLVRAGAKLTAPGYLTAKLPAAMRPLARRVYDNIPLVRRVTGKVHVWFNPPLFSGWRMTTSNALPWDDEFDWERFRHAADVVRHDFEHGLRADTSVSANNVDELRWRHAIVTMCVRYAVRFSTEATMALVECGVADGITAYFACAEADRLGADFTMHCYDSWASMRVEDFHSSEAVTPQRYAAASLARARRNLNRFAERIVFHPGYLPEAFSIPPPGPQTVVYLSIDLNAVRPTLAALENFLPRLSDRAVILFDDYGDPSHRPTKLAVDEFCSPLPGVLLKLPTGQAAYFA